MKILAVVSGPVGVGLYSLLRQIQVTLSTLAMVGGQNAIVQGVASRSGASREAFVSWVLVVVSAVSLLVAFALLASAEHVARAFLPESSADPDLVRWIALAVVIGALSVAIRSVLNGCMAIGWVAWVNIATAGTSMLLAYPAAKFLALGSFTSPALLLVSSLSMGLLVGMRAAAGRGCLRWLGRAAFRRNAALAREFLRLALPSLLTLLAGLGAVLAVRASIAGNQGLAAAGYFDAAWSVSVTLVVAFLTSVQTYLLPALSERQHSEAGRDLLLRAIRLSVFIAVPLLTALIVLKPWLIRLFYSADFMPAIALLRWTLLGDFLRVVGWVLATSLLARADMRSYVIAELVWNGCFLGLASCELLVGIEAVGPAYVSAYGIYFAVLLWRVTRVHALKLSVASIYQWLCGAAVIGAVSAWTWHDTTVTASDFALLLVPVVAIWLNLSAGERNAMKAMLASLLRRGAHR